MDSYWFGIIGVLATIVGAVAGLFYGRRQNQELTSKVEHLTEALATTRKQERQILQKTIISLASVQMDIQKLAEKPKFSAASATLHELRWNLLQNLAQKVEDTPAQTHRNWLATGLISQDEALDAALLLEIKNEGEYSYPFVSSSKQDLPFLGIFISGLLEWLKSRLNVENYEKTEGITLLEEDALFHSEIKNELLKSRKGSKVAAICGTEGLSRHKLEDYWRGNREAALNGVQIRRVFVIAQDIHRSDRDALINVLKWHGPISETEHSLGSIESRYVRIVESVSDPILGSLPKECDFGFMGILGQRLAVRRWFPLIEQKRPIIGLGYRTESKIALQLYFSFFDALWTRAKPLTGDTLDAVTNLQETDEG